MIFCLILAILVVILGIEFLYKGVKIQDWFLIYEGIMNLIIATVVLIFIYLNYF